MKSDRVYKRAFNEALDILSTLRAGRSAAVGECAGQTAPGQPDHGAQGFVGTRGQSDRRCDRMANAGLVTTDFAAFAVSPRPKPCRCRTQVEKQFMEWMLRDNASPGTIIQRTRTGAAVRRRHHRHPRVPFPLQPFRPDRETPEWRLAFQGLHHRFRARTFRDPRDVRTALGQDFRQPARTLAAVVAARSAAHRPPRDCSRQIDERFHDFSDLDNRFHRLVNSASPNRFIDDFYDIISIIFHYHYQWNKQDERTRNEVALREHLDYIAALQSHDERAVEQACRAHLTSAKKTLIRATLG